MPTNFVLGFILMWVSRFELQQGEPRILSRPVLLSWLFSALIFCPVTGWSFYAYPAWATVYLRPEEQIPTWSGPVIVSHYFLGMVFGTLLAQHFIRFKAWAWFWGTFLLALFWLGSIAVLTGDEYNHIGTYAEYHSGQARLIFEDSDFMKSLNIMSVLIGVPGVGLIVYLWKRSQRIRYIFRV